MTDTQTPRRATGRSMPIVDAPGGATTPHPTNDLSKSIQDPSGGATTSRQAMGDSHSNAVSPAGADSPPTIGSSATKVDASGGEQLADHQAHGEAQAAPVVSDQAADRHICLATHTACAVGADAAPDPAAKLQPTPKSESLLDPALALAADVLDDLERVRTANQNRLRQLTRSAEDKDGEVRGLGLDERHPDVAKLAAIVDMLGNVEVEAVKNLERIMRRHPLGPWAKGIRGVGDKQIGRLLAVIGDPYVRPEIVLDDESVVLAGPRTVSALWAYCGLHVLPAAQRSDASHSSNGGRSGGNPGHPGLDAQSIDAGVAPKRARGQKANWSTRAKTRAYLIAESCLKQLVKPCTTGGHVEDCRCSQYRIVYDIGKAKYADALHPADCAQCGPKGKPALAGSPLSAGHQHARAMRLVMKELLKDLWREAKRIHESTAEEATQ